MEGLKNIHIADPQIISKTPKSSKYYKNTSCNI